MKNHLVRLSGALLILCLLLLVFTLFTQGEDSVRRRLGEHVVKIDSISFVGWPVGPR